MSEMSKTRRVLMTLSIWFSSFAVMYSMLTFVIANDLYVAFPESEALVTASLSWPMLLVGVSGLIAGWLLRFLSTKAELTIGAILIILGIIPRFVPTPEMVLAFTLVQGIGAGFSNTAGMALISQLYADEGSRSKQMGFYNFAMAIMGVVTSFGGGMLAVGGWQFGYDIFWIAVPVLITTVAFIPNIKAGTVDEEAPVEEAGADPDQAPAAVKKGFGGRFVTFFIAMFLWAIVWYLVQGFSSVYIAENGLGDVSFAGTCTSLTTVGSAICCASFGFFFPKLRRKVTCVAYVVAIASYLVLWLFPSVPTAAICCIAGGGCYGTLFTALFAYSAECVTAAQNGMAMGAMTLNYSLGGTIAIYVWAFFMELTGSVTACFPYAIAIMAVGLVIEVVASIKDDRDGFLMS